MRPDELLADLDPSQRGAVTDPGAPLAILAPAGSGKTRVLTRRIAWQAATGNLDANHVLAVTFTRKAAGELRARLGRLGVRGNLSAGTFHSVALAQLRRRYAEQGTTMPALLDRKARLLGPLIGGKRGADLAVAINELASEIEWAKARRVAPGAYADQARATGRDTPVAADEVAAIYGRYEKEKKRRGLLDFDDLIAACTDALEQDPEFAAVQRWRFRHVFVDEFQDVTRAQLDLLRGWVGGRPDLCVVGDPDQAIYAFAGADSGLLTRFPRLFEGATLVRLDANYRSTPQIVEAARAVLPPQERAAVRAAGVDGPPAEITAYPDDTAEARGVAGKLQRAHTPFRPWSTMAVLYRVNAQSAPFEEALRRAGIPYRVRGAAAFLDRPEVKAVIDDLRKAAKASPRVAFAEHLRDLDVETRRPPRGDNDEELERELSDEPRSISEERREHIEAVVALGREYLAADGGAGSVAGFLEYLRASLRGGDDGGITDDAVELLTFHRAKGLEWDTVFVTGLERGLVPISHASGDHAAIAEERRLLYVALSRAERQLHLSWARERARGNRVSNRTKSPYLTEIERAVGGAPPEASTGDNRRGAEQARKQLAGVESGEVALADKPLYDALVTWRRELARASAVPAYVIFDNKTLRGVAEARPRSSPELLALPGIGPTKLERYGAALLEVVGEHSA